MGTPLGPKYAAAVSPAGGPTSQSIRMQGRQDSKIKAYETTAESAAQLLRNWPGCYCLGPQDTRDCDNDISMSLPQLCRESAVIRARRYQI